MAATRLIIAKKFKKFIADLDKDIEARKEYQNLKHEQWHESENGIEYKEDTERLIFMYDTILEFSNELNDEQL